MLKLFIISLMYFLYLLNKTNYIEGTFRKQLQLQIQIVLTKPFLCSLEGIKEILLYMPSMH